MIVGGRGGGTTTKLTEHAQVHVRDRTEGAARHEHHVAGRRHGNERPYSGFRLTKCEGARARSKCVFNRISICDACELAKFRQACTHLELELEHALSALSVVCYRCCGGRTQDEAAQVPLSWAV